MNERWSSRKHFVQCVMLAVLLAGLVLTCSCSLGRRTATQGATSEGYSSSASVSFHTEEDEAALEHGKQAAVDGKYEEAVTVLTRLYNNRSARAEFRASALLQLGSVFTNVLNPRRDEERAYDYFRKLVEEFPDSEHRAEAEIRMERLRPSGE